MKMLSGQDRICKNSLFQIAEVAQMLEKSNLSRWHFDVGLIVTFALLLFVFVVTADTARAQVTLDSSASGGSACCFNGSGNVNAGSVHTVGNGSNRLLIAGI